MKKITSIISIITVLTIIITLFTGCHGLNSPDSATQQSSVAILISKNALSGMLSLNSQRLNDDVRAAALSEGKVSAILADGDPFIISEQRVEKDENNKSQSRTRQKAKNAINSLSTAISVATPQSREIDLISAINLAIDSVTASDTVGTRRTIYVLSNGFSTKGILNMLSFNIFNTNIDLLADEVSEYVKDLSGIHVVWLNLGDVNRDVQQTPDTSQLNALENFYTTLIKAKGGTVDFLNDKSSSVVDTEGYPEVTPVKIPQNALNPETIEVILDNEQLQFEKNSAKLIDEKAAKAIFANIAPTIIRSGKTIYLIGSTASYDSETFCKELSKARCQTVEKLLREQNVTNEIRIIAIGRDKNSPLRVRDLDSNGNLIPQEAAKNRFVLITSDPESFL